ncbi:MAG: rod shape-determining protein MreC [Gammaproteobacteria bacterium]|nr:rod shape-determining protein MreC [Gammaproteobacteria bacterium]
MPFTKNKTIDRSNPNYSGLRIILIFILSSGMMYLDFQGNYTDRLRSYLSVAVLPIQIAANAPKKIINNLKNKLSDRESILTENQLLKKEIIQLYSKVQQTYKLEAENKRLFELLKAKPEDGENFIFADIIAVNQDNDKHQIIINKGSMDGIELGAAIADSKGIIGHIVRDQVLASEVLLISDPEHGIPIEIARNGLRAIAIGIGSYDEIILNNLPNNSDIKINDVLITSGLGGRYPEGYPVAIISNIERVKGDSYLSIGAKPIANLKNINEVLVIQDIKKNYPNE